MIPGVRFEYRLFEELDVLRQSNFRNCIIKPKLKTVFRRLKPYFIPYSICIFCSNT